MPNNPTPIPAGTRATPMPPMAGLALSRVSDQTTPRSVTAAPPSAVTFPPKVAPVAVTAAKVGLAANVGATASVVNVAVDE